MPGTPPPSIPLENKPDILSSLVLPIAQEYLGYKQLKKELDPPYSDEELRGNLPPEDKGSDQDTTDDSENLMSFNFGGGGSTVSQLTNFISKRSRNKASSQLGSSFLTSALG